MQSTAPHVSLPLCMLAYHVILTEPCHVFAGWPDYPFASMFALVTIICVLALEHLVSRAYERRLTKQLSSRPQSQGEWFSEMSRTCIPDGGAWQPE